MKGKTKLISILCIILVSSILSRISFNEYSEKYVESNQVLKSDLYSNSDDNWRSLITRAVGDEPLGVFVGDANNDGYNDIATANYDSDTVSILLWNSIYGTLFPQIPLSVGIHPYDVFIGDANNDGYNDIASANSGSDTVSILLWNNISGYWNSQIVRSVGNVPHSVFISDTNNDGYNDIAISNYVSDTVSILLWNATLKDWDLPINQTVGDGPRKVFIGDVNNDGYNDIATSNWLSDDVSVILWNSTLGDWDSQITRSVGIMPYNMYVGDANNDGYNDIAVALYDSGTVSIFLWNSTLSDWNSPITRFMGYGCFNVFIGDANNDGYNDVVTVSEPLSNVSILLWDSTLDDWDPPISKFIGYYPYSVFIGDANNDGYNDIVSAIRDSDEVSILLWEPLHLNVEIINMSFFPSEFRIEFSVKNENDEGIDFASINIWWNGTDMTSNIQNLEDGYYSITLDPITITPGEEPILLNMTISASGYEATYCETYISIESPEMVNYLHLEIVDHSYSLEHFNFTFKVCDVIGQEIETAIFQLWWNGSDLSSDVQSLGNGYYFISLKPITITPGEEPILLNMTISASGYEDTYYETYIAIDPDTLDKGTGGPPEFPFLLVITISVVSAGVTIGALYIYLVRKRHRKVI